MKMSDEEKMNANNLLFGSALVPEKDLATDLNKMWSEHEKKMEEFREKVRKDQRREELIMRVLLIGTPIIALFLLGRAGFFDWRVAVAGFVAGYVVMTFLLRMRGG